MIIFENNTQQPQSGKICKNLIFYLLLYTNGNKVSANKKIVMFLMAKRYSINYFTVKKTTRPTHSQCFFNYIKWFLKALSDPEGFN